MGLATISKTVSRTACGIVSGLATISKTVSKPFPHLGTIRNMEWSSGRCAAVMGIVALPMACLAVKRFARIRLAYDEPIVANRECARGLDRPETRKFHPTVKLAPATAIEVSTPGALRSETHHAAVKRASTCHTQGSHNSKQWSAGVPKNHMQSNRHDTSPCCWAAASAQTFRPVLNTAGLVEKFARRRMWTSHLERPNA